MQNHLFFVPLIKGLVKISFRFRCSNPMFSLFSFTSEADDAVFDDVMEAFCDNIDSGVELPELGTWVAIKITAIFNPGHFWAQLPYGTEPLEKLIIEGNFRKYKTSASRYS